MDVNSCFFRILFSFWSDFLPPPPCFIAYTTYYYYTQSLDGQQHRVTGYDVCGNTAGYAISMTTSLAEAAPDRYASILINDNCYRTWEGLLMQQQPETADEMAGPNYQWIEIHTESFRRPRPEICGLCDSTAISSTRNTTVDQLLEHLRNSIDFRDKQIVKHLRQLCKYSFGLLAFKISRRGFNNWFHLVRYNTKSMYGWRCICLNKTVCMFPFY